jgi:hypothetical protein
MTGKSITTKITIHDVTSNCRRRTTSHGLVETGIHPMSMKDFLKG